MLKEEVQKELIALLGKESCFFSKEDLIAYSADANNELKALPDGVILPKTAEEISAIFKIVNKHLIPLVPRGAGSGYTGGCIAIEGGIVMSMEKFNKILEIDTENNLIIVEPGVITKTIQDTVEKLGLIYPPDPASAAFSTIGGNIAENAGGLRAVKYGVTKHYVMGLEVVLPNGDIVHTGSKCIKDVAGFNLTELFVGSEGTLGVVTKAMLKLVTKPEARCTMTATFASLEQAAIAIKAIFATGVRLSTLEFLDKISIEAVEKATKFGAKPEEAALLLIEVDGFEQCLNYEADKIEKACQDSGTITFRKAKDEEEREKLWQARKDLSYALFEISDEWEDDDISVPVARIPQMVEILDGIAEKYKIIIANLGHYGDGNIHVSMTTGKKGVHLPEGARKEILEAVVKLEGRIAAEHGVGCLKRDKLHYNIDEPTMKMMRSFKNLFDPNGILNPGKVIPKE